MHGMKHIQLAAIKAGPDDGLGDGEVEALFTVYGAKDAHRQRVPGGDSLDGFAKAVNAGDVTVPIVWQHEIRDPWLYIGEVKSVDTNATGKNGEAGASVRMQLDVDDNPTAKQAYKQIKGRRIPNWSYRWSGTATKASDGVEDLSDMWLYEISPVLQGAVGETHTLSVKSADGRKSYVDIDVPGSFETIQEAIGQALAEKYPRGDNLDAPWACLVATMADRACYQVSGGEQDDALFWVPYTIGSDGSATLGEETPAQATLKDAEGVKGASGSTSLPLHPDRNRTFNGWGKSADGAVAGMKVGADTAEGRIRAWASSDGSGDPDKMDWAKFATVHFWVSDDADARKTFAGYKLLFCDVVDGKVYAIWRGVTVAAAEVQGARGGLNVPAGDVPGIKAKIAAYYAKARKEFDDDSIEVPWEQKTAPMTTVDASLKLLADLPSLDPVA